MTTKRKKTTPMPEPPAKRPSNPRGGELLADDLETLASLLAAEKAAKLDAAQATEARTNFEQYVFDRMAFEKVPAQRAGDRTWYVSYKPYAKIQDKSAFVAWAEENEPELLEEYKVREGDLNTAVRRLLDDQVDLPPGVGYYMKRDIGSRAA